MWLFFFLFAFGVGTLWWIENYMKKLCDDLDYLIELIEQNPDLVNKQDNQTKEQDNQTKEQDNQIRSRKDLYN